MRFPVIPTIFLLLLLITGAVIVPNSLQILPDKQILVDRLNAQSGLQLTVKGEVRLRFLPRLQVIFNDVTIGSEVETAQKFRAEKLIINLSALDLAQKAISVQGVYLLRADSELFLGKGLGGLIERLTQITHPGIRFIDSKFSVRGLSTYDGGRAVKIEHVTLDLPARAPGDDVRATLRQTIPGRPEAVFRGRLGNIDARRQDLSVALQFAANERISFDGFLRQTAQDWRADGEMRVNSDAMLSGLVQAHLPIGLTQAARRVAFSGLVQFDKTGARSENLEITALDTVFQSRLALDWPQAADEVPLLSGRLSTGIINLENLSSAPRNPLADGSEISAIWQAFERQMNIALRVEATRFDIGEESGQNLLLAFDWQDDVIDVQRFSLDLPFRSLFLANGRLDIGDTDTAFNGSFSTRSTDALAAVLWLGNLAGIDSSGLIEVLDESRLQRVSLVGDIGWSPEALELRAVSGRLGDDRLAANMNFEPANPWRGQIDLQIERLDLADWGAVNIGADSDQNVITALLAPLNTSMAGLLKDEDTERNLRLNIAADTLFSGVSNLGSVEFTAQISDQMLYLRRLSLSDYRGLAMEIDGRMHYDAASPYGSVKARIQGESAMPPTLANLLPFSLPQASSVEYVAEWQLTAPDAPDWPNTTLRGEGRLGDIETGLVLQGPARQISFDEAGQKLELTMQGKAESIAQLVNLAEAYQGSNQGALTLEMENQSSNVATLNVDLTMDEDRLSLLGSVRRGATGRRIEGAVNYDLTDALRLFMPDSNATSMPVSGTAQITSDVESFAFSGLNAAIGAGRLTGEGVVDFTSELPKLTANIKADGLDMSWMLPDYGAAGWSDEAMQWSAFARADLDVELSGSNISLGPMPIETLVARVKLLDGVMEAPQITGRLLGGGFDASLLAEGGSLTPFFNLDMRLSDLRPAALVSQIYPRNPLRAPLSGTFNVSGRGASPAAMIASLNGAMQFDLGEGQLRFIDMAAFEAAVERPDFGGRAAALLTPLSEGMVSPFERGVGLVNVREGQVEEATIDLVFDTAISPRGGRFEGQLDFVSGNALAEFMLYPTQSDKKLVWQISGPVAKPKIALDAAEFDRAPSPPIPSSSEAVSAPATNQE